MIPIIINYHISSAQRCTQLLHKTGHLHTLSGNERHAESQQTRSIGRSLFPHFLHPFTARVWLNSSGRAHILYSSQCQNKTSRHISKVQQNNSGATNTRVFTCAAVLVQKKKKKNAQASLFYNWRWCKCWLNAEKQAIRFCISERKNFELNVCLPKYLLICGANNTALILQWNKTTWLLTLWCRYGSFLSRPEVRVHSMVQAKPWNGSNRILANQQEYGGKKRNVASRVSSVCTTNSKI